MDSHRMFVYRLVCAEVEEFNGSTLEAYVPVSLHDKVVRNRHDGKLQRFRVVQIIHMPEASLMLCLAPDGQPFERNANG